MTKTEEKAALILVPLLFVVFCLGLLLMFFIKPPTYYCPLPKEMSEMQTPSRTIEIPAAMFCRENKSGGLTCSYPEG